MSKKKRISLDDLKVTSFVTSQNDKAPDTIKGGATVLCTADPIICNYTERPVCWVGSAPYGNCNSNAAWCTVPK